MSLASIGDLISPLSQCIEEGIALLLRCYGRFHEKSLTDARKRIWKTRITAPILESFPPTDEAHHENLKMSHLQAAIWRYSLNSHPPDVDIYHYGCLVAKYGPVDFKNFKILKCGCKASEPCKTAKC